MVGIPNTTGMLLGDLVHLHLEFLFPLDGTVSRHTERIYPKVRILDAFVRCSIFSSDCCDRPLGGLIL